MNALNAKHEGRGVRQMPNQTALITPSLSMLLLAGFLLIFGSVLR